jgi:hypothetical protein
VQSMKKQLTEAQFLVCIQGLEVGQQTIEIARGVLVLGQPQSAFVKALGVTKGAVSQAVNRVWSAHEARASIPQGFERVQAVLPDHQAFIVKKWAEEAAKKVGPKLKTRATKETRA